MLMVRVDQVRVASSDPALLAVTVKPRMSLAGTLPVNTCELRVLPVLGVRHQREEDYH